MRPFLGAFVALSLACCSAPHVLGAELLSQALRSFPVGTRSIEYENLAELRKRSDYASLRQQYSGPSLDAVKKVLSKVGISEERIQEVVRGAEDSGSYGIVSGDFSAAQATQHTAKPGLRPVPIENAQAQCSSAGICILFLQKSLAAFGGPTELKAMLQAHRGTAPSLSANTASTALLAKADPTAPVIGLAPGSELTEWIGDSIPKALLSESSRVLANIRLFEYSVTFDQKAHLTANLECISATSAVSLRETLAAIGALRSLIPNFAGNASSPQFENLNVASSENFVHLTMDVGIQ